MRGGLVKDVGNAERFIEDERVIGGGRQSARG